MKLISTREELRELEAELNVSADWHEPDNSGVGARMIGTHLDNAFGARDDRFIASDGFEFGEFNVILTGEDDEGIARDVAAVNLANLFAWACER